jgi:predicted RNase H-like HicB family nuclease
MYKDVEGGVYAEVLDFPGTISFGKDLSEARKNLGDALVDMAETNLLLGKSLPTPDASRSESEADLEEPIHLLLTAASRVMQVPEAAA